MYLSERVAGTIRVTRGQVCAFQVTFSYYYWTYTTMYLLTQCSLTLPPHFHRLQLLMLLIRPHRRLQVWFPNFLLSIMIHDNTYRLFSPPNWLRFFVIIHPWISPPAEKMLPSHRDRHLISCHLCDNFSSCTLCSSRTQRPQNLLSLDFGSINALNTDHVPNPWVSTQDPSNPRRPDPYKSVWVGSRPSICLGLTQTNPCLTLKKRLL